MNLTVYAEIELTVRVNEYEPATHGYFDERRGEGEPPTGELIDWDIVDKDGEPLPQVMALLGKWNVEMIEDEIRAQYEAGRERCESD